MSQVSYVLGQKAKLYFYNKSGGQVNTPGPLPNPLPNPMVPADWAEIGNTKDVTLNLEKGEADVTTRQANGWRAKVGTLKDGSIEFEMVWDSGNTAFNAIKSAYFNDTALGIQCLDGANSLAASQGLQGDFSVTNFTRNEPLEEVLTVKVTLKPTYSANAPQWINGVGA